MTMRKIGKTPCVPGITEISVATMIKGDGSRGTMIRFSITADGATKIKSHTFIPEQSTKTEMGRLIRIAARELERGAPVDERRQIKQMSKYGKKVSDRATQERRVLLEELTA